jgi:hypothetical protein
MITKRHIIDKVTAPGHKTRFAMLKNEPIPDLPDIPTRGMTIYVKNAWLNCLLAYTAVCCTSPTALQSI